MSTAVHIEVIERIRLAFDTPASRWIESLPIYKCGVCGVDTIFKGDCGRHDEE
jgi:hypothetical protein